MANSPKLKIKNHFKKPLEEIICDLSEGQEILSEYLPENYKTMMLNAVIVAVEGKLIHTYDELLQIANQDFYKNKAFLEVVIHPAFGGG